MFAFFDTFTDSFILSIILWPFASALLTFPLLLTHYLRFRYVSLPHALLTYCAVLYVLALAAFTLYPFPENATEFCHAYTLTPHLTPLNSLLDIATVGQRAILQVIANILFFVPLGVFLQVLFRCNLGIILLISLAASLTIETAQLTGAFGQYPCSYRLFDIDDLLWNTTGGIVGAMIALILPPLRHDTSRTITTQPGIVRRMTGFIADLIATEALSLLVLITLLLAHITTDDNTLIRTAIFWLVTISVQVCMPLITKGMTIGGYLVGMSLDDKPRPPATRVLLYLARIAYIGCLLSGPFITPLAVLITCISWLRWQRLPYHFIDMLNLSSHSHQKRG